MRGHTGIDDTTSPIGQGSYCGRRCRGAKEAGALWPKTIAPLSSRVLAIAHRRPVAGLGADVGRREEHAAAILPMARQRQRGSAAGAMERRAGLRMAHDPGESHQGSPARLGRPRRQAGDGSHNRGLNTKLQLAVEAFAMPLSVIVTDASCADCTQAHALLAGMTAEPLLADPGADSEAIVKQAQEHARAALIAPRKNRPAQRE